MCFYDLIPLCFAELISIRSAWRRSSDFFLEEDIWREGFYGRFDGSGYIAGSFEKSAASRRQKFRAHQLTSFQPIGETIAAKIFCPIAILFDREISKIENAAIDLDPADARPQLRNTYRDLCRRFQEVSDRRVTVRSFP